MSSHFHNVRRRTAWGLTAIAMSPLALCFGSSTPELHLSPVTGRVTFCGRPFGEMTICLDSHGQHAAFGAVKADGSFQLLDMGWSRDGARPGRYRAHFYTHNRHVHIPSKYADPRTSGVEIEIASDWNDVSIDLR